MDCGEGRVAFNEIGVAIPMYNAGARVAEVIKRVCQLVAAKQVVVVDDGSTDGGPTALRDSGVTIISHTSNRGKGAALRTAFAYFGTQSHYLAVVTLDADGQHPPEELPRFVEEFKKNRPDLVIGCRQLTSKHMPVSRVMSNRITSSLLSRLLGCAILDSQSGYRLYSTRLITSLELTTFGYETETEVLIKAARNRFKLAFVPISTIYQDEPSHIRGIRDVARFVKLYVSSVCGEN